MNLKQSIQVLAGMVLIFALQLFAFTEPTLSPPAGNVPAPLHVGVEGQSKSGGLVVNTGGATTGLVVRNLNTSTTTPGNVETPFITRKNVSGSYSVGIGTSTPESALEVVGNIILGGISPTYRIKNVAVPVDDGDVATKGYVSAAGGGAAGWSYFGMFGGDGSDGDLTVPVGGTVITAARKQYNNLTLNGPLTVSADTNYPTGIFMAVKGTLTINIGGSMSVNGRGQNGGGDGGWGGAGVPTHGEQNCVGSELYYLPSIFNHAVGLSYLFDFRLAMPCVTGAGGGGGGGGGNGYWSGGSWTANRGGSGGGAAGSGGGGGGASIDAGCPTCLGGMGSDAGTPSVANAAKVSALLFDKTSLFLFRMPYDVAEKVLIAGAGGGRGGGSGYCEGGAAGAIGGKGGGVIYIEANAILNNATGAVVTANGENGANGVKGRDSTTTYGGGGCGGGGGGGGGLLYVRGKIITSFNSSNVSVAGGSGGTGGLGGTTTASGSTNGGRGGNGATGAVGTVLIEKIQ